jgi:hypothetical protein
MLADLDNAYEIGQEVARLLQKAEAGDRLPTRVDDIVAAAQLSCSTEYVLSEAKIAQAPKALRRLLRSAGRKIKGVLDRRERVIHVEESVTNDARRDFIRLHETCHDVFPWQRELVFGDTDGTLAPSIDLRFEREANQGAAELLFQRDLLQRIARDYPTDISTPAALHVLFGASFHSTFRRWIETHKHALLGVVLSPQPVTRNPLRYQRHEQIASHAWRDRFGNGWLPRRIGPNFFPFIQDLEGSRTSAVNIDEFPWPGSGGDRVALRVQALSTPYRHFMLFWLPHRERLVPRLRRREILIGQ